MKKVTAAKQGGQWEQPVQKPTLDFDMPEEFARALRDNSEARRTFESLAPTYQKQLLGRIITAKKETIRENKIQESIRLLAECEKLGLR